MAKESSIEWTHSTFNPVWGCAKVSPACDNCYAERDAHRFGTEWGVDAARREFGEKHWLQPEIWDRAAEKSGERHRVFCASMADVFDKNWPEGTRERLWKLIERTQNLDWLLLTKRVGNVQKMVPEKWMQDGFPKNVWMGISVCNQDELVRDVPKLLNLPAFIRFLSMEPLLESVDLNAIQHLKQLHWIIVGGESGKHARPMHPEWVRSLRDQCESAGIPFLFKQFGEWVPADIATQKQLEDAAEYSLRTAYVARDGKWHDGADGADFLGGEAEVIYFGKKRAGRVLDGVTHDGYPENAK